MNVQNAIRRCLNCGEPLPERCRKDRKFCPHKNGIKDFCKNATHNPKTSLAYHDAKGLNKINQLNKNILQRLLGSLQHRQISEHELINEGFKLEFIINKAEMSISKNEAFLYLNFGLEVLGNNNYKIFKHGRRF